MSIDEKWVALAESTERLIDENAKLRKCRAEVAELRRRIRLARKLWLAVPDGPDDDLEAIDHLLDRRKPLKAGRR